ncbi:hypothetical protein GCM10009749_25210 [Agromyces neolithicus]|uniref:Uncharacterized protein n=1 Tax=Agromyces neolithicus TaxID=269420 RepID=A0ABN2M8K9_9MICO
MTRMHSAAPRRATRMHSAAPRHLSARLLAVRQLVWRRSVPRRLVLRRAVPRRRAPPPRTAATTSRHRIGGHPGCGSSRTGVDFLVGANPDHRSKGET